MSPTLMYSTLGNSLADYFTSVFLSSPIWARFVQPPLKSAPVFPEIALSCVFSEETISCGDAFSFLYLFHPR